MRVCALVLEQDADGPRFRRRTRSRHRFAGVGANPAAYVTPSRLDLLEKDIIAAGSDAELEDLMIQVLREAAQAGHPVGQDAMCVRISSQRAVPRIRFAPAVQQSATFSDEERGRTYTAPAIFTPAIVTPTCAQPACVGTGPPFENLDGFQIEWVLPSLPPPSVPGEQVLAWRVQGQARKRARG